MYTSTRLFEGHLGNDKIIVFVCDVSQETYEMDRRRLWLLSTSLVLSINGPVVVRVIWRPFFLLQRTREILGIKFVTSRYPCLVQCLHPNFYIYLICNSLLNLLICTGDLSPTSYTWRTKDRKGEGYVSYVLRALYLAPRPPFSYRNCRNIIYEDKDQDPPLSFYQSKYSNSTTETSGITGLRLIQYHQTRRP